MASFTFNTKILDNPDKVIEGLRVLMAHRQAYGWTIDITLANTGGNKGKFTVTITPDPTQEQIQHLIADL